MKTQSLIGQIIIVAAIFLMASLVLSIVFGLIGGLLGLFFRFGIPLLLAYALVKWLTGVRQNRSRNYYK